MQYRREIDGLRAIAVSSVVLYHAGLHGFGGGFVGVDVFFVISGYLITSIILLEKQAGSFTLTGFYERRARRILPALFLVMLLCLPFAWLWMMPHQIQEFSESLVAVALFSSNILFWKQSDYFDAAAELKPLLHTWSLAVEEQYYLLFPLFLLVAWRLGKRLTAGVLLILAAISLTLAQRGSLAEPAATFYLLPTRFWELLIGVLVAFYLSEREVGPGATRWGHEAAIGEFAGLGGVLLIGYAVVALDKNTPFPGVYALIPTIGAALVILFANPWTLIGKVLGSAPLVGVGLISYSVYLWHQPILAFLRLRTSDFELSGPGVLIYLAAVLSAGYLSFRFVEKPFRSKRAISKIQVIALSLAGVGIFVSLGLEGHTTKGFLAWKLASVPVERRHVLVNVDKERALQEELFEANRNVLKAPRFSTDTSTRKVLVIGDSMGYDLATALGANQASFPGYEFRLLQLSNVCVYDLGPAANSTCQNDLKNLLSNTLLRSSDLMVVTFLWEDGANFAAIEQFLSNLRSINRSLVILGTASFLDIASLSFNIALDDRIATQDDIDRLVFQSRRMKYERGNERIASFATTLGVPYFDRKDLYCDTEKRRCRIIFIDGGSVLWDRAHLTVGGMKITAERIAQLGWLSSSTIKVGYQ
jgi:peptidoglycan/LPS O-acetylase OafA/YrhL